MIKSADWTLTLEDAPGIPRAVFLAECLECGGRSPESAEESLSVEMWAEQLTGNGAVSPATDVFALGAVLAYALTGRGPFEPADPTAEPNDMMVAYRTVHEEPDLGHLPAPLHGLITRCLAKNPADRPTVPDVLDLATRAAGPGTGAPAGAPATPPPAPSPTVPDPPPAPPAPLHAAPTRSAVPAPGRRSAARTAVLAGLGVAAATVTAAAVWWLLPDSPEDPGGGRPTGTDSPPDGAEETEETQETQDTAPAWGYETLTIGVKFDQPGLGMQNAADGTLSGFDVDVATYIAESLGVDAAGIEWVEATPARRESMLQAGEADFVVANYTITDARQEVIDFAGPYLHVAQGILVRRGDVVDDVSPLSGRILCSVTGTTGARRLRDTVASGATLHDAASYGECLQALANGEVDAVTADDALLAGYAAQPEYQGMFELAEPRYFEGQYGIGVRKNRPDLWDLIDEALAAMVADGSWDRYIDQNFGGTGFTPAAPGPDRG
ncbi:transporter substrate-binding domain-containing protein [Streptomyces aidingensis]|uniref:transporter substrate-binding domain-containing protein n=1 Tax=Streptomyces aidingensis TaxID=910347 RepID=UPI001587E2AD|nr:transporter substrate-binding domain-containing protein [Streptomyces aidingensis]